MQIFWSFYIFIGISIQISFTLQNDFDLIVFTQQWPTTTCLKSGRPPQQCNIPQNDDWTIHGIWPSRSRKNNHPAKCRPDLQFRVSELRNIRAKLQTKWISVFDKNPERFWKYEWEKHGTCSVVLSSLNSIEKYFQTALLWNWMYDIKYMLNNSTIVPGRKYSITQILNTLNKKLGVSPQVKCTKDKEKNQYLDEVRICFNKTLKLISCKQHLSPETNCDFKKLVEYPSRIDNSLKDDHLI